MKTYSSDGEGYDRKRHPTVIVEQLSMIDTKAPDVLEVRLVDRLPDERVAINRARKSCEWTCQSRK